MQARRCEPGGRRWFPAVLALTLLVGCGAPRVCAEAPFSDTARTALQDATARVDFGPLLPCVLDDDSSVDAVFVDELPGSRPDPRINFVVARSGQQAFVLGQTRAVVPFTQIPQGTHWVRLRAGGVTAAGFAGPSGSGVDIAYMRWRAREVTFELTGTLGPCLSEAEFKALAVALMERS